MTVTAFGFEPTETGWGALGVSSPGVSDAPRKVPFKWRKPLEKASMTWEQWVPTFKSWVDAAVLPGQAATPASISEHVARSRLNKLIDRICADPELMGEDTSVAAATGAASKFLLSVLPDGRLPRIAPNREGGMLFFWSEVPRLVATIEGWRLHYVVNAGTPQAEYHDDVVFAADASPSELVHLVAAR